MKLLNSGSRPAELRALGIGLLEQFASPAIRQWLVKRVMVRRGFFRRFALAPRTPEVRACLGVLYRAFRSDPHTAEVWRRVEAGEPPGLYRGPVSLADGRVVPGILYPRELAEGHRDISDHGGWRAYWASRTATEAGEG